jgi:predicted Zn finger-like uncharacterized protein
MPRADASNGFGRGKPNQKIVDCGMIVVCPTCATHHDVPQSHLGVDGAMIRCAVCGHSWIESRAVSVVDVPVLHEVVPLLPKREAGRDVLTDREVYRLASAAKAAEAKFAAERHRRRKELRGWFLLLGAIAIPALVGLIMPNEIARAVPPARMIYSIAGLDVNVLGLEFRNVGQQRSVINGVQVLAVQGEIVNTARGERTIPRLAFYLKDREQRAVYDWRLDSAARPIRPGETSTFLTRVASPPEVAKYIEIRFAPDGETGSNATP